MASAAAGQVHIEGLQTALPTRVVPPGRARPVSVAAAAPPLPAHALLQRRARVVLYYRGGDGDGAPWEEAMWVKESLSEALADHPEMAGRLRRRAADGSAWEVKLNDTGVRLVLATADGGVDDFVGAEDRACREAALAPWTDVDAENPDICALFFLQLTRFQGDGGYAVGVSCSLMLADPLSLARFLLSWSRTHADLKARNKVATNPMLQYASYFRRPDVMTKRIKSIPLDDGTGGSEGGVETVLFRVAVTGSPPDHRALARACLDQASHKLGAAAKAPLLFSVVVVAGKGEGDNPAGMSLETCAAESGDGAEHKLEAVQWQELGLEDLTLRGTKPVHVSYSIETGSDEGLVVVMPDGAGFLVTATVPNAK